ncbi:MAG: hypothetical protein JW720_05740 [Sedimentisphaerales bacterium]|nr:hypothetical protein [Sedimentisphaerales bacterium]
MKQDTKNDNNPINRLLGQLAAEKKKTSIALLLIAVMIVMWVKVFTNKGPQKAPAAPPVPQTNTQKQIDEEIKVSYVDLPEIEGRNDSINRDFFASDNWQHFELFGEADTTVDIQDVSSTPNDNSKKVVAIIAQHLRLQAVGMDQKPQAFINDKLMSAGDKLVVTDGTQEYECEVVEIEDSSVTVRCREAEIVLKLVQGAEGDG